MPTVSRLVFITSAIALATSCTPENQCQYQDVGFCSPNPNPGDPTCTGRLLDSTHWQSGPIDGTWQDFSHNKSVDIHLRDAVTGDQLLGDIFNLECYTSPVANPVSPGQQFAGGAGNLCEFFLAHDGDTPGWVVTVHNDTCADYFVYLAVEAVPTGGADGGADSAAAGD